MNLEPEYREPLSATQRFQEKQITDIRLCYLVCPTDAAGGYLGAILLTDHRARPIHYAYVQPVRPTKIQRILYGSTLDEYLKVEVIAQKLWQGLPEKPDVLFVEVEQLLAFRRIAGVPTAFIAKEPETQANSSMPLMLKYDVGPYSADETFVGNVIASLDGSCNLLEPFNRIRQALAESLKASA